MIELLTTWFQHPSHPGHIAELAVILLAVAVGAGNVFGGWPEMPWKRKRVECPDCGGEGGIGREWTETVMEHSPNCYGGEWGRLSTAYSCTGVRRGSMPALRNERMDLLR